MLCCGTSMVRNGGSRLRCSICNRTEKKEGLLSPSLLGSVPNYMDLIRMQHVPLFLTFDTAYPRILELMRRVWEFAGEALRCTLLRLWPGPSSNLDPCMRKHLKEHLQIFPFKDLDSFDANPRKRNKLARRFLRETLAVHMARGKKSAILNLHMRATREVYPRHFTRGEQEDLFKLMDGEGCPDCFFKGSHEELQKHLKDHKKVSFHTSFWKHECRKFNLLPWEEVYPESNVQAPHSIGRRRDCAPLFNDERAPERRKRRRLAKV